MKIPRSFLAFQSLVSESIIQEVDPTPVVKRGEEVLSFLCDMILSSLHTVDEFRDAVVDSRVNNTNNSVLLMLNPEVNTELIKKLMDSIGGLEGVRQVVYGARQDAKGHMVRALKVTGRA